MLGSMLQWEYIVVPMPVALKEQQVALNAHGNEGWELCWIGNYTAYFKRPVQQTGGIA